MEEDCLIYDSLLFSPAHMDLSQLGLLEGYLYVGSMWFVTPSIQQIDIKRLNEKLQQFAHVKACASFLDDKAINVRWLASDLVLLKQEMNNIWHEFTNYRS